MLCLYYQARIDRSWCWFVAAVLKSYEHVAFDRTVDKKESRLEFFVPQSTERYFLAIMNDLAERNIVSELEKLPNRMGVSLISEKNVKCEISPLSDRVRF